MIHFALGNPQEWEGLRRLPGIPIWTTSTLGPPIMQIIRLD